MNMKVVINNQAGGFCLSEAACQRIGLDWDGYGYAFSFCDDGLSSPPGTYLKRTDAKLVECVEELGTAANGHLARLEVVVIPDNVEKWTITSHNGIESVVEITGRVWSGRSDNDAEIEEAAQE